ncbi:MAG TPA: hypothetical protein VKG92_02950 [Flavobacteriales bacterium]|nr:hypothetical protein [Flavobacteriales bacterium]
MRILASLALLYYALGVFVLQGNFSVLGGISAMYDHCKTTEDKDLTWADFITDHLVCFDALVDNHPPGDDQRPHRSPPVNEYAGTAPLFTIAQSLPLDGHFFIPTTDRNYPVAVDLYRFDPLDLVFRPPNG